MFGESVRYYDKFYAWKDYAAEGVVHGLDVPRAGDLSRDAFVRGFDSAPIVTRFDQGNAR